MRGEDEISFGYSLSRSSLETFPQSKATTVNVPGSRSAAHFMPTASVVSALYLAVTLLAFLLAHLFNGARKVSSVNQV